MTSIVSVEVASENPLIIVFHMGLYTIILTFWNLYQILKSELSRLLCKDKEKNVPGGLHDSNYRNDNHISSAEYFGVSTQCDMDKEFWLMMHSEKWKTGYC